MKGKDYIGVGCWGIVTNNNDEVLLIKKKINDYWERPGGNVEVSEALEECAVREIYEECSVKTKIVDFISFEEVLFGPESDHWIAFCYHLEYISGRLKNNEPEIHDKVKWFPISDLPKNLSPYTAKAIKVFLQKR